MFDQLSSRKGYSLDRLRAFVEVASAGSIAAAAGRDHPDRQAQYSRQIKQLSEFFGGDLTRPEGRGLVLTRLGEAVAELGREHLTALEGAICDEPGGPLNLALGGGDSLLQWLVIPQVPSIQAELVKIRAQLRQARLDEIRHLLKRARTAQAKTKPAPAAESSLINRLQTEETRLLAADPTAGVTITLHDLRNHDIHNRLASLTLDFGVMRKDARQHPLKAKDLGEIRYQLCVPRSRCPGSTPPSLEWVLAELPLVTQGRATLFHAQFQQALRDRSLTVKVPLYCESFPEVREALLTGQYAAILPSLAKLPDDYFQLPLPFLGLAARRMVLAWNPRMLQLKPALGRIAPVLEKLLKFE